MRHSVRKNTTIIIIKCTIYDGNRLEWNKQKEQL